MKRFFAFLAFLLTNLYLLAGNHFPQIVETAQPGFFPLSGAAIYTDSKDFKVVEITASMLADDVERVTGKRPQQAVVKKLPQGAAVVAGTLGKSALVTQLLKQLKLVTQKP